MARLAESQARKFGAARAGYTAGLFHDLGKYTAGFQSRLRGGESVDHATAGARAVLDEAAAPDLLMAELIAHAIAGHHGGMPDRRGDDGATLDARLTREREALAPIWRMEIGAVAGDLWPGGFRPHGELRRRPFQLAMLGRFLFSCLVDADFRDTEAFAASPLRGGVDRNVDGEALTARQSSRPFAGAWIETIERRSPALP